MKKLLSLCLLLFVGADGAIPEQLPEEKLEQILQKQTDLQMRDLCARVGILGLHKLLSKNSYIQEWLDFKKEQHDVCFSFYEIKYAHEVMDLAIKDCKNREDTCYKALKQYVSSNWHEQFCGEKELLDDLLGIREEHTLQDRLHNWLMGGLYGGYYFAFNKDSSDFKLRNERKFVVYQELIARFAIVSLSYQDFKNCDDESKKLVQTWLAKENDIRSKFSIKGIEGKVIEKEMEQFWSPNAAPALRLPHVDHAQVALLCQNHQKDCFEYFKRYVDPIWLAEFEARRDALSKELDIKNIPRDSDEKNS